MCTSNLVFNFCSHIIWASTQSNTFQFFFTFLPLLHNCYIDMCTLYFSKKVSGHNNFLYTTRNNLFPSKFFAYMTSASIFQYGFQTISLHAIPSYILQLFFPDINGCLAYSFSPCFVLCKLSIYKNSSVKEITNLFTCC